MNKIILGAVAALSLSAAAVSAQAATFLLTYTSPDAPTSADLVLTVDNTAISPGVFEILGVTGSVGADTVLAITPNPTAPVASISADGLFIFDNNFFSAPPVLSNPGLLFHSATVEYNLFSNTPTQYQLYSAPADVNGNFHYGATSIGSLSVTAVPEPASWAMMLTGFFGLGSLLRARRTRVLVRA